MKLITRASLGLTTIVIAANMFAGSAFAGYTSYPVKYTSYSKPNCYTPCYNKCKPVRPGWGYGDKNHYHVGPPGLDR
jgi:hypothetical protein